MVPGSSTVTREGEQFCLNYYSIDAEAPYKFRSAIAMRRDRYLSVPEQELIRIFQDSQNE